MVTKTEKLEFPVACLVSLSTGCLCWFDERQRTGFRHLTPCQFAFRSQKKDSRVSVKHFSNLSQIRKPVFCDAKGKCSKMMVEVGAAESTRG